jgi:hypothetical protein
LIGRSAGGAGKVRGVEEERVAEREDACGGVVEVVVGAGWD